MTTFVLNNQVLTITASSDIPTLYYALEKMKIHTASLRHYPGPNHRQVAELRKLALVYNVLREVLRYRRVASHNQKEEDIVKVVGPLIDAVDSIYNQQ